MGDPRNKKRFVRVLPVVLLLTAGVILLILGIILIPVFNLIVKEELNTMIPMSNTSSTLSTWKDPGDSVNMNMKFYFFDLTNPSEVAEGKKPYVIQRGPYTYKEIKVKKNVTFDTEAHTATYVEPRTLVFDRSLSVGDENDTFITINVPLVAVVTMIQSIPAAEMVLSGLIDFGLIKDEQLFKRLSVYQLIWGYKDPLMELLAPLVKAANISLPVPMDGYFGFLYKKNETDDGVYTVNTGQAGLNSFMQVQEWNHKSTLSFWKTKYCNMINGTDGTMYHPFIDVKDKLFLFSSDLARSIDVVFSSKHYLHDVPQYRFKPPAALFGYPPDNYDNACYCLGDECPHNGVLNITAVQGAPVFVSQPHFLNGKYYEATIGGLHPDEERHNTFIDVEPTTGIVMKGAKRLQMNLYVKQNAFVWEMSKMRTMLYPLLWLDESATINDKGLSTFKDMFFNIQQLMYTISYILIAVSAAIILLTLLFMLIKYLGYRNSQTSETTPLLNGGLEPRRASSPINT
ncbi:lysosome membrane protein 2-like isoform X2 [Watersipora subatra]|uniref:lysosome membrane protein 2-like isoform X2 n=1 Tax=Watersipora subatra TaxID=2589382 RepID=UPI00355B6742